MKYLTPEELAELKKEKALKAIEEASGHITNDDIFLKAISTAASVRILLEYVHDYSADMIGRNEYDNIAYALTAIRDSLDELEAMACILTGDGNIDDMCLIPSRKYS